MMNRWVTIFYPLRDNNIYVYIIIIIIIETSLVLKLTPTASVDGPLALRRANKAGTPSCRACFFSVLIVS